jgi:hypothetical protein
MEAYTVMQDSESPDLEPAHSIIERLGGKALVARHLGLAYTAPYRWTYPHAAGGTGGKIPSRHIPALMVLARARKVELWLEDFFPQVKTAPKAAPKAAPPRPKKSDKRFRWRRQQRRG